MFLFQKVDPHGKPTFSAHPGKLFRKLIVLYLYSTDFYKYYNYLLFKISRIKKKILQMTASIWFCGLDRSYQNC